VSRLVFSGISKNFGAIQALTDVSLSIEPGEVLGLMGDNGAGKSTLVKIIAGNFRPSTGDISIDGKHVVFHKPLDAQREGVEMVYQDLALADNLSAASNVFLGREPLRRFGPIRYIDYARMNEVSAELFKQLKSETRPRQLVRRMSGGQRQAVAIARTLLSEPKIVMMDEPRSRHQRDPDQPSYARHLQRRRQDRRPAPRPAGLPQIRGRLVP
jgi:simple sugar transport system ATP-binding protein